MKLQTERMLNLLQTVAILVGLTYGALELTQFRGEQQRQSRIELARSFMTPEFHDAYALVLSIPDGIDRETVITAYADELPKLFLLAQTFETIGILVYQGDLELSMVDDFMGTGILTAWKKLERWHKGTREEFGDPYIAEWFQWLAEQLHKYRSLDASEPAYESFHDWRPQK